MIKKTINIINRLPVKVVLYIFISGIIGCSPARHMQEGEYLIRRNNINIISNEGYSIDKKTFENYISQKPNTRILGIFPFHLSMYNTLNRGKERKWKNKLMNVIGEKPVIYDSFLAEKTEDQFKRLMDNKGFYNSKVYREEKFGKKTVKINYFIEPGKPWLIRNIDFDIKDSLLINEILPDTSGNTLLKKRKPLDISTLEDERGRISVSLKKRGFYNFNKEFISFLVDTSLNSHQADISVKVTKYPQKVNQETIYLPHKKYKLNKVYIYLDMGQSGIITDSLSVDFIPDTLNIDNSVFVFKGKPTIDPLVILKKISIKPGNIYSITDVENTYRYLSGLQQFKFINIQFSEGKDKLAESDSLSFLNCYIRLNRMSSQSYQLEFEATNSSTHWGLGGNILYRHKNIFGGGEIFDTKLSGAFEIQHDAISGTLSENSYQNTREYGIESKILFPGFLAPFKLGKVIEKYHPKTVVFGNYNFQNRPDYTRIIVTGGFGYQWKTNANLKHIFNPLELNAINLKDTSAEFSQYFDTLFLRHSYESQFISASSYTREYSSQDENKHQDFIFMRSHTEIAGNIISIINSISGTRSEEGYYQLFNNRYAQYVKSDIDFRFYHYINPTSYIAYRGFAGVGVPYGNSDVLPFVKKYFSGGSNGIRAWQVRSLGPGSFVDNSDFPDLAADIKLEANIEYRFDIFRELKGAFFVDAGNIWAINKYDDRDGAKFRANSFYKEIAVGTGLGLRIDFGFILFRIDLGLKVVDPELPEGDRLIWKSRRPEIGDWNWNVGIGYPF